MSNTTNSISSDYRVGPFATRQGKYLLRYIFLFTALLIRNFCFIHNWIWIIEIGYFFLSYFFLGLHFVECVMLSNMVPFFHNILFLIWSFPVQQINWQHTKYCFVKCKIKQQSHSHTTVCISVAHGQSRKIRYIEIQFDFHFLEDDVYQYNAVSFHHLSTNTGRAGLHPCNQVSIGSQGMEGSRREKKMPSPNFIPMCSDRELARSLRRNLYSTPAIWSRYL